MNLAEGRRRRPAVTRALNNRCPQGRGSELRTCFGWNLFQTGCRHGTRSLESIFYTRAAVGHAEIGDTGGAADHVSCLGYRVRMLDIDFLSNFDRVVDLDTKVTNRALDLGMAKQQLDCSKISGAPVDQYRLCSAQRVGAELGRIESDAGDPFMDHPCILPGGHSSHAVATAGKQELSSRSTGEP